jgi:hypothetical protein
VSAATLDFGRVEVDLCGVTGFSDEGASALVACRHAMPPARLVFRTDGGPGGEALLAAFAEAVEIPAAADGVEPAPA